MIRRIVQIEQSKCDGCGACVRACHEGAIELINGKATLIRDDYCDGLGDCLPTCHTDAITFIERDAAAFDANAVAKNMETKAKAEPTITKCKTLNMQNEKSCKRTDGGCPGVKAKTFSKVMGCDGTSFHSELCSWPVQLQLAPVTAPYYDNADLLIAADCTAFACGDFHSRFMKGHITLIGCPKLDSFSYVEKLAAILSSNNIKSIALSRMEVPCCGGLESALKSAIAESNKNLPLQVSIITTSGTVL